MNDEITESAQINPKRQRPRATTDFLVSDLRSVASRPHRLEIVALLVIVALAVALRAYHLGYKSLWLDEINYARSAFGGGQLFAPFGMSILDHPPAYLFITRLVLQVGRDEWLLRLVPLLAGLASIVVLWAWTRRLFGPATALVAAFLFTVTPMHVEYSQEAHSYGMYCLLSVLTLWLLYRAAQIEVDATAGHQAVKLNGLRTWGPFALAAVLNMYVHYYAFYVVALSVLLFPLFMLDASGDRLASLWREQTRRRAILHLLTTLMIIAVLYAPQAIIGVRNSLTYAADLDSTFRGSPRDAIVWAGRAVTVPWERNRLASLGFVAILATGLGWLLWRRRALAVALLALLILPLPPSIWLAYRTGIAFNMRRVIFMLPVWVLIAAVGLMALAMLAGWIVQKAQRSRDADPPTAAQAGQRATAIAVLALVLAVGLVSIAPLVSYYRSPKQDWKTLGRVLLSQVEPGDVVVAPGWTARTLAWYYPLVQPIDNDLRPRIENLCKSTGAVYVVSSINEPLSNENTTWLAQTSVLVPFKDLRLHYRNCNRYADEWFGAGAGPLFRMAYDPKLPFPLMRDTYTKYLADERAHLAKLGVAVGNPSSIAAPLPPAQPFSLRTEAEQLVKEGDNEAALALYQSLVDFNPRELANRMGFANTLMALKRFDEALVEFNSIQEEWPDYPWAYIREGQAKERTGQAELAFAAYRRAIDVAPKDADVRFFVANVYLRSNRREDAIRELQAGLELAPDREKPRQTLEELLKAN